MKVTEKQLLKLLKENKIGFILNDYTRGGYLIGGVHGFGLKELCPENYTAEDLEKAYEIYVHFCEVLKIEPRKFNEVV